MWLALKPGLKSGRFEEFKQELAAKIKYAQEHLEEIIAEREEAEKKHGRITAELDEIKVSVIQFCHRYSQYSEKAHLKLNITLCNQIFKYSHI